MRGLKTAFKFRFKCELIDKQRKKFGTFAEAKYIVCDDIIYLIKAVHLILVALHICSVLSCLELEHFMSHIVNKPHIDFRICAI